MIDLTPVFNDLATDHTIDVHLSPLHSFPAGWNAQERMVMSTTHHNAHSNPVPFSNGVLDGVMNIRESAPDYHDELLQPLTSGSRGR